MSRKSGTAAVFVLFIGLLWPGPVILAQQAKAAVTPGAGSGLSPDKALTLAEQGRCQESSSALKRAITGQVPAETRKRAGRSRLHRRPDPPTQQTVCRRPRRTFYPYTRLLRFIDPTGPGSRPHGPAIH